MAEGTENTPKSNMPNSGNQGNNQKNNNEKNNEKDVFDSTGSNKSKNIAEHATDAGKAIGNMQKSTGARKAIIDVLRHVLIVLSPWWEIVVIAIIVLIGIYYFVTTIPGLAIERLKQLAQDGLSMVKSWFISDANANVNEEDIADLANYLEEMEYDLIGYGFIVPTSSTTTDYPTYTELIDAGYQYSSIEYTNEDGTTTAYRYYKTDESGTIHIYGEDGYGYTNENGTTNNSGLYYNALGVLINNETGAMTSEDTYIDKYGLERSTEKTNSSGQGEIVGTGNANTKLLRTYLLSDYRIYSIRNNDENLTNQIFSAIDSFFGGYDSAWAKGLLKFYYATDGLATEAWSADFLSVLTNGFIDIGDSISISDDGTEMSISSGYFNNPFTFKINGWADRYGMSLEFLLSLHLATGSPDLVYAMLQSFDTEVQVYLNDSGEASVSGGYVDLLDDEDTLDEDLITWDDVTASIDQASEWGVINWWQRRTTGGDDNLVGVDSWSFTKKFCQYLLEDLDLTSPDNCLGSAKWQTILKSTYATDRYTYNYLEEDYGITEDVDEDLYDDVEGYSDLEYEFISDDGDTLDFNMDNITFQLGTDDEAWLSDNSELTTFIDAAQSYGYNDADDVEETVETEEYSTQHSNNGLGMGTIACYSTERVRKVRTWTAEVDGEEVEFEWVTYKYLIYVTGTTTSTSTTINEYDEPEWYDTIIVEWIVRDKTDAELYAEGIIDENGNVLDSEGLCWDGNGGNAMEKTDWENGETKKCCKNCKKYIKKLMKAIANVTDSNYSYYTPYIARVLGSWFRDTYFVIPESIGYGEGQDLAIQDYINEANRSDVEMATIENSYGTNGSYVVVDEEYLAETEEYWTAYEMADNRRLSVVLFISKWSNYN